MHLWILAAIVACVAFAWWYKTSTAEKFTTMKLYRPKDETIPENEWDPASILTASLPGPTLVVQPGNYRRFNRI